MHRTVARTLAPLAVAGLILLGGCSQAEPPVTQAMPTASTAPPPSEPSTAPSVAPAEPSPTSSLCAELPSDPNGDSRDAEGWWNNSPADADGNIIQDLDQWPDWRLHDHPRVAVVEASTAEVIATYDRIACGQIPDLTLTGHSTWPASGVIVVDADSGELLQELEPTDE